METKSVQHVDVVQVDQNLPLLHQYVHHLVHGRVLAHEQPVDLLELLLLENFAVQLVACLLVAEEHV